ncbi:MAG TPA: DUF302 domain-containing protein [Candidatus Baltobacteraceae bacterium]|nr:DUF302 domain-containing protein [Candidatus Baltobacteraceae bacterium]
MSQTTPVRYGHTTKTALSFEAAVREAKSALSAQGFGVLCEIDVAKTLKEKLGIEQQPLLILGSCNPSFAHQAMEREPGVALFLPCNVVLRKTEDGVEVSAIDANVMMGFIGNAALEPVASEVDKRLRAVIAAIPPN